MSPRRRGGGAPLRLGAGEHEVDNIPARIDWYKAQVAFGPMYYSDFPAPSDALGAAELAFGTLLGAWQRPMPRIQTFKSLLNAGEATIQDIPTTPLGDCSPDQLCALAEGLSSRAYSWDGFGVSTVSKVIHRKRRASVPILDRQAVSGAYVSMEWEPGVVAHGRDPGYGGVMHTLELMVRDLTCTDNADGWTAALFAWPGLEDIELLDVLWWSVWRTPESATDAPIRGCHGEQ